MSALVGTRVVLRPIVAADAPAVRAMRATPEVVIWWGPEDEPWPLEQDADTTGLAIEAGGEVAGYIQFTEENDPDYRHASIDLFLGPRHLGRGLGTDALRTLIRHLIDDRGHHRLTIDPAVDNEAAIRCYEGVGFQRVGVMHAYWRDHRTGEWRDGLLMELVSIGPIAASPRDALATRPGDPARRSGPFTACRSGSGPPDHSMKG